ncbi:MAG: hypothetical protein GX444_18140 [Myxococcales bacterium]|nr:hypothetical protein [Myxococcales bacterium]
MDQIKRLFFMVAALLGICFLQPALFADQFQELWQTTEAVHDDAANEPFDLVVTADGMIYLSYGYEGSTYFTAAGKLAKINDAGHFLWRKTVASDGISGIQIRVDANENIYTASAIIPDIIGAPCQSYFSKYKTGGALAWRHANSSQATCFAMGAITADDRFAFALTKAVYLGPWLGYANQLWLGAYSPDGTQEWLSRWDQDITDGDEVPAALLPDREGNFYIFGENLDSDYKTILAGKYTSAGKNLWKYSVNDSSYNNFVAGAVDEQGNTYVTGYFDSVSDYLFVFSADPQGQIRWENFYGHYLAGDHRPSAFALTPAGDVLVAGYTTNENGDKDLLLLCFSAEGEGKWLWQQDESLGGDDLLAYGALAVDAGGNAYLVGVVDSGSVWNRKLYKIDSQGELVAAIECGAQDQSYRPAEIGLDAAGNVYLAATENDAVWIGKYGQICDGCRIDGLCRAAGEANPDNPCEVCDPPQNEDAWSAAADDTVCDDGLFCNGADRCLAGACSGHEGDPCEAADSCDETADQCVPAATDDDDTGGDDAADDDAPDDDDGGAADDDAPDDDDDNDDLTCCG